MPQEMQASSRPDSLIHGLSFDIECYYQIVAKDYLRTRLTPTPEVEANTDWILDQLAERDIKATFFTLGNVALAYPTLIQRMVAEGHELAVHGYDHLYITELKPAAFRDELLRAIGTLEDVGGVAIKGHRAPAFSIVDRTIWATDILRDLGLHYDSSIYPIAGKRYGIAGAPLGPWRLENGLVELPLTAVRWRGRRLPAAGGGYVRLFPYRYTRWAIGQCAREGRPAISYFHPYEFAPDGPSLAKVPASGDKTARRRLVKFNLLQRVGRGEAMRRKLLRLLSEFRFAPLGTLARAVPQ